MIYILKVCLLIVYFIIGAASVTVVSAIIIKSKRIDTLFKAHGYDRYYCYGVHMGYKCYVDGNVNVIYLCDIERLSVKKIKNLYLSRK